MNSVLSANSNHDLQSVSILEASFEDPDKVVGPLIALSKNDVDLRPSALRSVRSFSLVALRLVCGCGVVGDV